MLGMRFVALRYGCLLMLWLAIPSSSFALLGENETELEQRYGKAVPELADHLGTVTINAYLVRGTVMTMVMLQRGKSICEAYTRGDKQKLPEHTIAACLRGNAQSQTWSEIPPEKGIARQWCLGKDSAYAAYYVSEPRDLLMVCAPAWLPYARKYISPLMSSQHESPRP